MSYIPALDGLRAVAILAVLLFHISPSTLRGGFTGVDVFFVLSGFLITSIILSDIGKGTFSITEFYTRRIQRLLPNTIAMVLFVLIMWAIWMSPNTAIQTAKHGLWTLFNFSNIYVWKNLGGYWGDGAEWAPLTHTWSLGIEEQFYMVFPLLLVVMMRRAPGRLLFWLSFVTLLSFGLCLAGTYLQPLATFYLLPTRGWEMALGAAVAAWQTTPGAQKELSGGNRSLVAWTGVMLILVGFLIAKEGIAFPGFVALAPTAGTALLIMAIADGETWISRMLSTAPMVKIGKVSYSLYLWHWPLITMGKVQAEIHGYSVQTGALIGGIIGILLGLAAYAWIEQPLRQRGEGRHRRLVIIGTSFAAVAITSQVLAVSLRSQEASSHFDPIAFRGQLYDTGIAPAGQQAKGARYYDVEFPAVPTREDHVWKQGGIIHPFSGQKPQVVVLGSSHALMYAAMIDEICQRKKLSVAFLCADSTPAFFETKTPRPFSEAKEALEFDETRKKWLKDWHPEALIVIDRWDLWAERPPAFDQHLNAFLKEVTPLADRVLLVTQVPAMRGGDSVNLREVVLSQIKAKGTLPPMQPNNLESFRIQTAASIEAAADQFPNLTVVRADRLFYQSDRSVKYAEGRSFFYADDDHLADSGAERARPLFEAAIDQAHSRASEELPLGQ